MAKPLRILLIDDLALVRRGIRALRGLSLTAILRWRYTAARDCGRPVRTNKTVTVSFTLH